MPVNMFKTLAKTAGIAATAITMMMPASQASAQEAILGEVRLFGFNFCPRGWASASGQLLPISQNTALFSLYGTIYGGDGRTTFALPDLRGRSAINFGNGPGLSDYRIGSRFGRETLTLTVGQMPAHNHMINSTNAVGDKNGPGSDFLAVSNQPGLDLYHEGPPNRQMDPGMVSQTGGSQPIDVRNPRLTMTYCAALTGIYPSRN